MDRFDKTEFLVLDCSVQGMYSLRGEARERALLLMDLGVFEHNPEGQWSYSGWTLTEAGKEYYAKFMKAVQEKHGHVWMTNRDGDPDFYEKDDEYSNSVDIFAYESGYHNGPVCKNCGYSFCQHCTNEFDVPECTNRTNRNEPAS